ncbi:phosphonate C-P lyase system protein PhnG [Flavobacteriaceae bacterium MHTCC 0001]
MHTDYILIEGDLSRIKSFVEILENKYEIEITKNPAIGLTMVRANDSVEHQEFYLGEVLVTETEVSVNNKVGSGICIGDEPIRSYCQAVFDAVLQLEDENYNEVITFLKKEADFISAKEKEENYEIQKTKVNFKLMEQS